MQTLSAEQRRFFEQAATTYQSDLAADTGGQAYLTGRGIDPQAAATFRLGVVRRPLTGHEQYTGRLAIPYVTPAGVVNLRFRCLAAHDCAVLNHPKYLSTEGAGTNLFNVLDLKRDSPFICVAEGEINTISLSLAGLPAVGVPGVDAWQKHFSRCLEDFEVIYAFGDGDKAGGKFSSFLARETRARPIRMPNGKDCNDILRDGGAAALRGLIQ
ncbi:toprim domain-containing protein [Streptomyces sp. NPDC050400]|uniref:toprim domain-containing protein n=1 Tax=Streptomyces sp. NPDC050400 TaxID=3365610 RepID=UPI00379B8F03